ncbi:MAG: 16S rRNA (cytosine(1402)-N(4))-methyltransferase RsmH [Pseudomonadota bacterium]|nr:16S rRNA (cytosine(1402)-N(4))-methyltransferase RsmH [Pseudomonadota bacterium]
MVEGSQCPDRPRHRPVLLKAVLAALAPQDGGIYVDATFGGGGYSRAILDEARARVFAIDRDRQAIAGGQALAQTFSGRLTLIEGRFSDMSALLSDHGVERADGVVFDVGVSSMQIDDASRGFSFQHDGPLDMRMEASGETAADAVNSLDEVRLAHIFAAFGEERRARAIARAIVRKRTERPLARTGELARLVEGVLGRRPQDHIHPATRTFQALRIHVNRELEELAEGLVAAEALLKPGGRLAAVTFHSLEDRIVKRFLALRSGKVARPSRHQPMTGEPPEPTFRLLTNGPVGAEPGEIENNPRARSAKLRAAVRTSAPPIGAGPSLGALAGPGSG